MIRTFALALVAAVVVTSGAIVGTGATNAGRTDGTSCSCSTVDLESGSATLVVLADGSGSVSQQITQSDGHTRVRTDVESGDASVKIEGETVANGSLLLNVTRNGEVVNRSVEVKGNQTLAFHVEDGNVRVTREDGSETCESACGLSEGVTDIDIGDSLGDLGDTDIEVNVGNIEVNGSDDETEDIAGEAEDIAEEAECATAAGENGADSSTDISRPPERSSAASGTEAGVLRVIVRSAPIAGLATPDGGSDCGSATEKATDQRPSSKFD